MASNGSSSRQRTLTPVSSRRSRRHSLSKTDDGFDDQNNASDIDLESRRRRRSSQDGPHVDDDDDDDDGIEAYEMDRFLSGTTTGQPRHAAQVDDVDDDDEEAAAKARRARELDGLDPDDPITLVKRAVPETDDPTLPALTFRVVVIGSFFACLGSAVAQVSGRKCSHPHSYLHAEQFPRLFPLRSYSSTSQIRPDSRRTLSSSSRSRWAAGCQELSQNASCVSR